MLCLALSYYNKAELEDRIDLSEDAAAAAAEAIEIKNAETKAMPKLSKKALKRKLRASGKSSDAGLSSSTTEEANEDQCDDTENDDSGVKEDKKITEDDKDSGNDKKKEETSQSQGSPTKPTEKAEEKEGEEKEKAGKKEDNDKDKGKEETKANETNETPEKSTQEQQQQQQGESTGAGAGSAPGTSTSKKNHKKKKKAKNGGVVNSPLTTPAPPVQLPINNEWANADAILKIKNGPTGVPSSSTTTTTTTTTSAMSSSAPLSVPTASKHSLGSSGTSLSSSVAGAPQTGIPQEHSSLAKLSSSLPLSTTIHNQSSFDKRDSTSPTSAGDVKGLPHNDGFRLSPQDYAGNEDGDVGDDREYRSVAGRYKSIYSIFLPYDYGDEKLIPLECPAWPEWTSLKNVINSAGDLITIDLTEGDPKAYTETTDFKSFFGAPFDEDEEDNGSGDEQN